MKIFLFVATLLLPFTILAQNPERNSLCEDVMSSRMEFLVDGSFNGEKALERNLSKLKECGLDDYDVQFFSNMNYMSGILRKLTQVKPLEQLRYGDLLEQLESVMVTERYQNLKSDTIKSEELGERVGTEQTWENDKFLFKELGASQRIIEAVGSYLRENPNNQKTYREILEFIQNN